MATKKSDSVPASVPLERSLDELEALVQKMEKGDLSLDDSLAAYERGVGLYRQCQNELEQAANRYHRARVPGSAKHVRSFLTYSSMSQVCRYANRVSYEVLAQAAPRLTRGLPEREEGLDDDAYWAR